MEKARLALFDIDGTLVDLFAVHEKAFPRVLMELYGVKGSLYDVDFSGDTIGNVVVRIAEKRGIGKQAAEAKRQLIHAAFGKVFREAIKEAEIKPLPGIKPLLEALAGKCVLGVISGNTREMAEIILSNAGLADHFSASAFGDEGRKREDLLELAESRAEKAAGKRFQPRDVLVFDDSIRGIKAAKKLGFAAVAVGTGPESERQLKEAQPDYYFNNLKATAKILRVLGF